MRSIRQIRSLLSPNPASKLRPRVSSGTFFEALEERKYLSNNLLGMTTTIPFQNPKVTISTDVGSMTYNHTTGALSAAIAPSIITLPNGSSFRIYSANQSAATPGHPTPAANSDFTINFVVDPNNNGQVVSGVPGNDFQLSGWIDANNDKIQQPSETSGVLLTGEILQFGHQDNGTSSDRFDFRFVPTGGLLFSLVQGKDIGVAVSAPNSTFVDTVAHPGFKSDFVATPQGSIGTITQLTPAISLVKLTNGTNNDNAPVSGAPDGPIVQVGSTVTWTYNATNSGPLPLTNVVVTDDQPGVTPAPVLQADHIHVVGDVDDNGLLDPGETWVYTATGIAVAGQYSNLGTVNATDIGGTPVTANNPDHYYAAVPEINIIKETNGTNNDTAPGLQVTQGDAITWEYDVTTSDHSGYEPVKNVVVTDDNGTPGNTADDFNPAPVLSGGFNVGDSNQNGLLDKGETWVFTATGVAQLGQYTNLGTVTGNGNLSNLPVTANNPDNYFANPIINIPPPVDITLVKDTDGTNNDSPPVAGIPDGPIVPVGNTVTWTYYVNNPPGNDPLTGIVITDDNGTPGDTSDDLSTTAGSITPILSGGFNTGDANQNGILDAGETWVYVATGTATVGQYSNLATVNAHDVNDVTSTVTDSNPDHYFGVTPQINIIKYTNGTNNDNPPVAGIPDGPIVPVGSTVTWEYDVTNPGNEPIANVALYDDQIGAVTNLISGDGNSNGLLDPGEVWVYTATGTATLGQYNNNGTVTGTSTISNTLLTASNPDHYFAVNPQIDIVKLTNGTNNDADPIPGTPDGPVVPVGSTVTWTYNVTTAGNEPIANVAVTDNVAGVTPAPVLSGGFNVGDTNQDGLLESGETWAFTASGIAIAGQYSNLGTVTGTSTISNTPVTSNNPDHYFGAQTAINTVANGPVVIGSGTFLGDTAQLSGGVNPTGTITFTLFNSSNVSVYTDIVTVTSGDGSYDVSTGTNPGGYLPTATGTYTWSATYSGDSSNSGSTDNGQNESETVTPASPAIDTVASGAVVIGSGTKLNDTAHLTGGFNPGGTITFTLFNPSNVAVFTDVVTAAGDGTYDTSVGNNPGGYLPSATGTYTWSATYSGDANNNGASDNGQNEAEAVTPAGPVIDTVASGTVVIGSGTKLNDTAHLTGGFNPGGTITFTLFNPSNVAVFTDVVTAAGDGTYTTAAGNNPGGYLPSATGTYTWSATYSGDSNNNGASDNGVNEAEVVSPAGPAIDTVANGSVVIGSGTKLNDTAHLTGGFNPTGTVTFTLYNPSHVAVFTDVVTASGDATYTTATGNNPGGYLPTATGTYMWSATYSGDSNNTGASDNGQNEAEAVTTAHPYINTTQMPATATVGSSIADKATVTGGFNPTGTVTFKLYSNSTGSGTPLYTNTQNLVGGVATSAGYIATAVGTDYWVATYNGDSNNVSVSSGTSDEPVCLNKATPAINTTQLPATALVGSLIADKATVTGGYNPTGQVTFKLYTNSTASGTPIFTDTETLVGGVATSAGYIAAATGTDYWVATYNGDSNNVSVKSGTADEPVCITPPAGSITGTKFLDATGNGFVPGSTDDIPLGGVTINLYKDVNNDGQYESGTDTLYATTTTSSTSGSSLGTYSFNNLPLGKYIVKESVPSGYVQTGPSVTVNGGVYAVNITSNGQVVPNNNFDDFLLDCDLSDFSNIYFVINGTKTVTDLRGNTHEGDTVTAYFTVNPGVPPHQLTLVSYTAPDSVFNANDASQQQEWRVDTNTFGPGQHSLTVQIPCCDYQIDFVCGAAIDKLGPAGSNVFYSAQGRLISADNGGTEAQCSNFATICGNVYNDLNCDGTFQGTECGLAGTCVTLTGTDDCGNTCTFTRYTDANGCYSFDGLRKGTYKVTETQPGGYNDGKDSVGSCGGTPSNNDCFSNIKVVYGNNGSGYNFGEVMPGAIDGYAYNDINNNGLIDRGEGGLAGVTVTLTGTNDLSQAVSASVKTDANGYYVFNNLRPGSYKLVEATPAGYTDGKDTVGSLGGGTGTNDAFTGVALNAGGDGINYNFGERKTTTTLVTGSTGSAAFWRNSQGQALIKALNGGSTATSLSHWLATTYPNLYGSSAGADNLTGKTNAQVAAFYQSLFNGSSQNVNADVMAAALSVYVTDSDLAGTTATSYNFKVSTTGLGALTASVAAANGSAFGTSTSSATTRTILQLLTATNGQAVNGNLYNGGASLLTSAFNVYDTLDRSGDLVA